LKYIDKENAYRRIVAKRYISEIKNSAILLPQLPEDENEHVWHLFVIQIKDRKQFQEDCLNHNIQTLFHYPIPPHKQEAYQNFNHLSFPLTEAIHNEVVSLPISPVISEEEVEHVCKFLNIND
jgi:dTDP-4-amino-4,6-dideoxygalactose transaminase